MSAFISLPLASLIPWHPWHVAAAVTVACAVLLAVARVQLARAKEDWANAYFYSPSLKPKVRQRRQRWQDVSWALLACTSAAAIATGAFYWVGPR